VHASEDCANSKQRSSRPCVEAVGGSVDEEQLAGVASSNGAALMRDMTSVLASHERRLIRSRTRAALAVKKARGERVGALPYGYTVAADRVTLEANAGEQAVLVVVRELRAAGLSHRAIVGELAARGLVSRVGRPFAQTQVARMLAKVA